MKKELNWKDWEKAYVNAVSEGNESKDDLIGYSQTGAADELKVTRQRIHQLINDDLLDQVIVIDKNGNICASFITNNSVKKYKTLDRKPGPKRRKK